MSNTSQPLYNAIVGIRDNFPLSYSNCAIWRVECIVLQNVCIYIEKSVFNDYLGSSNSINDVSKTMFQALPKWEITNGQEKIWVSYRNDPKFSDLEEQSDHGLHCLLFHLHLFDVTL